MTSHPRQGLFGATQDRAQTLRIRRFLIAVGSYLLWFVTALTATALDLIQISHRTLLIAGLALAASQALVYLAFRTRYNLRFADPALTVPQMMLGITWGLVLVAWAPQIRGYMLMAVVVTLLFGIFALTRRQFAWLSLFAYGGYLGVIAHEIIKGTSIHPTAYHAVSASIFAVVLLWTTLFGAYVSKVRHRLSLRNDALETALEHNQRLAERDDLTGLFNRRFLTEALAREVARAGRNASPLSIAIIDLDHFKRVNDQYGHSTGDRVLRDFSDFILSQLREMDYVGHSSEDGGAFGRYGGEEFMLILPETPLDKAHRCVERLRTGFDRNTRDDARPPHVTLSAGVAQYAPGEPIESILRRADRALYEAKGNGRNQVCLAA